MSIRHPASRHHSSGMVAALAVIAAVFALAPAAAQANSLHTCGNDAPIGRFCYYETKARSIIPGIIGLHGVSKQGECRHDSRGNDKYCSDMLASGPRAAGTCNVALSRSNRYCEVNR